MSLIQVTDLSFTYEGSYAPVFEHVSFQIDTDWKLGFTGRNGRGKTTFLRLLMGELEYTGRISSSVEFDYFPFQVEDKERETREVLEQVLGDTPFWQLDRELSRLQVAEDVLYRPFSTLSNGEQTKVLLAALFLRDGHFLLIDEPTNHLDREARQLVSRYLNSKKGFILVSHDRAFLDGCVDHILAINREDIEVQKGNFSSWYENRQRQDAFELGENERLKKDIRRLQSAARQSRDWADKVEDTKLGWCPKKAKTFIGTRAYIGEKSRRMQQRRKNLERRQEAAIEEKQDLLKNAESVEDLKLFPLTHHSDRLVVLEQVAACYGEPPSPVCRAVGLELRRGGRVSFQGRNGCGKSSLIRLILAGADEGRDGGPHGRSENALSCTGKLWEAAGMKISYVSQDTSYLRGSLSQYAREYDVEEQLFYALLRKLDFSREQFDKPMETYSEGQKKKVLIARSLCEQAHLYIWDEPLNFIDVYSRMQIEALILKFQPTMILVEHDETFTEKVSTEVLEIVRC
ncbi:ribosomal protection-like ABC-F family protein [Clostridium sp. AN503]|uniref:ribosomal protection-like ABC-F family protein n=1 Tax=Clostridium sp. AN503 TaxID=3160598 RepID=UPI0034579DED